MQEIAKARYRGEGEKVLWWLGLLGLLGIVLRCGGLGTHTHTHLLCTPEAFGLQADHRP